MEHSTIPQRQCPQTGGHPAAAGDRAPPAVIGQPSGTSADRIARLEFLAEVSGVLMHSLSHVDESLQALCDLAVPRIADWCIIELHDIRRPHLPAIAHSDAASMMAARDLHERYGSVLNLLSHHGLLTDEPDATVVTDDLLQAIAGDGQHLEALRRLRLRSILAVPLEAGDQQLGMLALVHAESGRRHDHDDHRLAQGLARHASIAAHNAQLFTERGHVADLLRRSLLPPQLPAIPGVQLAGHYVPADANEVGGDFYDAMGSGQDWVFVVGDVCGKGIEAAALASMTRHTARAAALRDPNPSNLLGLLNDTLLQHDLTESFCTAVCGHLHIERGEAFLTLASGGHPAPLLLRGDGTLQTLEATGPLVGVWPDSRYPSTTVVLRPGDLLFSYTDGLSEARRDDDLYGTDRIEEAVRATAGMSAETTIKDVLADMVAAGFTQRDDLALLALGLLPSE
jgi:phosphoserine phosphatase RsbU/P